MTSNDNEDRIDMTKDETTDDIPSEHPRTTSKENKEPTSSDSFHNFRLLFDVFRHLDPGAGRPRETLV